MTEEKTTDEKTGGAESPNVPTSKVKEFVTGLTDEQFAEVKSVVDTDAARRKPPDFGRMTDNELAEYMP